MTNLAKINGRLRVLAKLNLKSCLLLLTATLLIICLFKPHMSLPKPMHHWFIVLDITQSMNVRDYKIQQNSLSRLAFAKQAIREGLRRLPCGSKVALALFTERNVTNIVRPLEVCAHFGALDETVAGLDWRMAWAADSFISHGLFDAIAQTKKTDPNMRLLFITDGQQAPPGNPQYMPAFSGKAGEVKGVILGAGNSEKSPIPKLDDQDNITGYWQPDEVLRYATFGMAHVQSALEMEQQQSDYQHGRNAPHGANPEAIANAHLSGLDEVNLQKLAKTTGLEYQALASTRTLSDAINTNRTTVWQSADTDLRPLFGLMTILILALYFMPTHYQQTLLHQIKFRRNK